MGRSLTRAALALISNLCIAGAVVMLFLLLLAGSRHHNPLDEIFFLQADTRGIPGAPDGIAHWTLYNVCNSRNGRNIDCGATQAAYPFDPVRNFGTTQNVPQRFIDSPRKYFYLSRFLYAIYIVDLFFACSALLFGLWAIFHRYGGYLSSLLSFLATFFAAFNAAVLTACFVMGQRAFRDAGRFARVGVKAFAFTWTILALLSLASLAYFLSARVGKKDREEGITEEHTRRKRRGFSRLGGVRGSWQDEEYGSEKRLGKRRGSGDS